MQKSVELLIVFTMDTDQKLSCQLVNKRGGLFLAHVPVYVTSWHGQKFNLPQF